MTDVSAAQVDLAATAPFALGTLEVRPATRQVLGAAGAERLAEPRALQVLIALAEAAGAVVSRDALVQRCWAGRIVGEDAIHRAVAKARQLADLTQPPAFAIETIARVGYRLQAAPAPAVEAAGEPMAAPAPRAGLPRRGLIAAAGAAVVAAGGAAAYWRLRPAAPLADPRIAVLPFDNLSPDPDLGFFADGLSEDILNALVRGGGMRVASRTSSFTFRGPAKAGASRALQADYLLDGSVLRDGDRLRVNAHLTAVATQQTLWSQTYDRKVGQALMIEDEVAGRVAAALKVRFAPAPPGAPWIDPVAFDLYMKGRWATRNHDIARLQTGEAQLRQAVAMEPRFAAAWFELAKNRWRSGLLLPLAEQPQAYATGRQAAERAIALDPRNGAAHGVLTQLTPAYGHWRELDRGLARGLELSPHDPNLLYWRAGFLLDTGRVRAAAAMVVQAQALDPLELFQNHQLTLTLTYAGRFREAEAAAARLEAIWPQELAAFWDRFWLRVSEGRDAEAIAVLEASRRTDDTAGERAILIQALRARLDGSAARRRDAGAALVGMAGRGMGYAGNAIPLLSRLGRFDEAIAVARSLYLRQGPVSIDRTVQFVGSRRFPPHGEASPNVLFHPFVAPLRRAGRLDEVFAGIGLTELWRTAAGPDA